MLAQPVDGVVVPRAGEAAQARRRTAAEILVVGVGRQQAVPEEGRVGAQALLRTPGEGAPARTRVVARVPGAASRGGAAQTHKPMDGTCNL